MFFVLSFLLKRFLNPSLPPPRVLWLQRPLPMATTERRPIRVQRGRRNSSACEPTWRAYGTNPTGGCGPSWLRAGVYTFSFSLFSTNITFCFPHPVFSSWRIRLIYDMLPSVFWKKKNEEKTPSVKTILFDCTCGNTQGISFWQVFCICYVFLLTVFLCFYCTRAVTDDAEKDREREKEREGTRNCK